MLAGWNRNSSISLRYQSSNRLDVEICSQCFSVLCCLIPTLYRAKVLTNVFHGLKVSGTHILFQRLEKRFIPLSILNIFTVSSVQVQGTKSIESEVKQGHFEFPSPTTLHCMKVYFENFWRNSVTLVVFPVAQNFHFMTRRASNYYVSHKWPLSHVELLSRLQLLDTGRMSID